MNRKIETEEKAENVVPYGMYCEGVKPSEIENYNREEYPYEISYDTSQLYLCPYNKTILDDNGEVIKTICQYCQSTDNENVFFIDDCKICGLNLSYIDWVICSIMSCINSHKKTIENLEDIINVEALIEDLKYNPDLYV